ncbi:MAG: hypothetical protein Q9187_001200 [Circinaria calcarea]
MVKGLSVLFDSKHDPVLVHVRALDLHLGAFEMGYIYLFMGCLRFGSPGDPGPILGLVRGHDRALVLAHAQRHGGLHAHGPAHVLDQVHDQVLVPLVDHLQVHEPVLALLLKHALVVERDVEGVLVDAPGRVEEHDDAGLVGPVAARDDVRVGVAAHDAGRYPDLAHGRRRRDAVVRQRSLVRIRDDDGAPDALFVLVHLRLRHRRLVALAGQVLVLVRLRGHERLQVELHGHVRGHAGVRAHVRDRVVRVLHPHRRAHIPVRTLGAELELGRDRLPVLDCVPGERRYLHWILHHHADTNMNTNGDICTICGESRNPHTARYEHVRLGLDEPPEPVLCKCKEPVKILESIRNKIEHTFSIVDVVQNTTMESLASPSLNMVLVDGVSAKASREVELRLNPSLSRAMFTKMKEGLFPNSSERMIREVGCIWWTGADSNVNAKVRKRSNGEAVVKVTKSRTKVAPGYVLAVSDEYGFDGRIMSVQYDVDMLEIRAPIKIRDTHVNVIARMYENDRMTSFAAEFEIEGDVTNTVVRSILCLSMGIVGTVSAMRDEIDSEFVADVRSSDHIVVDVPDLTGYKGSYMAKADGVKVYVFCYEFGYVVCVTDPDFTVVSCMVTITHRVLPEMSKRPDVLLAEMMMNGDMVYIDILAMNGIGKLPETMNKHRVMSTTEWPNMIFRESWDRMPSRIRLELEPTPNDGVVLVTQFRTLRLKEPTVDLLYSGGKLSALENGVMVPIADGNENMEQDMVYEMDVVKTNDESLIRLMRPRQRTLKKIPNSMDVVRRAIASANKDPTINATLLDITSMSFAMRERVYTLAQANSPRNRKVIVTFGVGRFQEWKQMMIDGFSYIAVDPEINIEDLTRRAKSVSVLPYDFGTNFNTQVLSISKRRSVVLWAKCKTDDFIRRAMPTRVMSTIGIPAVFSFSISYHIPTINMLRTNGVKMFGCGFVHDAMPRSGIGREPVTMRSKNAARSSSAEVVSTFGKSTYVEPYLSRSHVPGLVLIKDAMPELWKAVDSNTIAIMERAVIMSA